MSYLVLARKWRPKRFAELVGQEHVVRALTNALETGRVHHAFLFTGTRGVGKTTIARIFAKSLNCETGTSSDPCGACETCLAIDAGRYIDLLEIDAASNTGVDDVRELIDNAQYMPSRGRVKVYLIDEVHMLSKSAFNALLKTLEEPPGHVKFLLATTDPQKLPVTVLSRCLQFNLKRLDEQQIQGQMTRILDAEGIAVEAGAIRQLSKAADGSLRDGLSLLDQAIAYTGAGGEGGALGDAAVATMLGSVDRTRVGALLSALADGDGSALLAEVATLAEFSPDWGGVLDAVSEALHRIQVRQLVPEVSVETDGVDVDAIASAVRPEVVQLWYQMALNGRRDVGLAPSPRAGFEMTVLRMLAFRPAEGGAAAPAAGSGNRASGPAAARAALGAQAAPASVPAPRTASPSPTPQVASAPPPAAVVAPPSARPAPAPVRTTPPVDVPPVAPPRAEAPPPAVAAKLRTLDAHQWLDLVAELPLRGPVRELAASAAFVALDGAVLRLALPEADEHLKAPIMVHQLCEALAGPLGGAPQIRFETAAASETVTLHERNARERDARQSNAESNFMSDPDVQRLMSQQGARLVPDSIRPFEERGFQ
ncbi:DNA polymerase III/DNA elongation factor III, tau and gamma subunits [Luteimonas sp. 9C]|uniref:DNA polymerase III subunit gamma/tau n=1 Tax=Luteimonas sp. 9C TaxID=2653148 RepID=UPI0012F15AFC|nr:DNA polymerase III subunit gamma/tau [Luteimonas sp. 9C]VXB69905.1 DNA polymerase III/DNA elongation factor III, tau and gamma subunits [Luteimonas sp. 9C]